MNNARFQSDIKNLKPLNHSKVCDICEAGYERRQIVTTSHLPAFDNCLTEST